MKYGGIMVKTLYMFYMIVKTLKCIPMEGSVKSHKVGVNLRVCMTVAEKYEMCLKTISFLLSVIGGMYHQMVL
jgi:hypothetical protein